MREVKQSATANVMVFMADSTDHITGKTALTLAVTISKDGAAFASITPTVTERGNGWYNVALATADTGTTGDLVVRATSTGADPGERTLNVVANVEADTYGRVGAPAGASVSADVAAVKSDSAAIKVKTDYLPSATAGAAGGVFIAGTNAATSITTALTANITGNLSGSVNSVTTAPPDSSGVTALLTRIPSALTITSGAVNINLSQTISTLIGLPSTVGGSLYFTRQVWQNKLSYNKTTNVMTLYEDDGTTAKMAHTMTDNATEATRGAGV